MVDISIKQLAAYLSLALLIAIGSTGQTSATNNWGGYHWARTSNPFTVKLGDNLTGTWKPHLAVSSSDWSQSVVLDTQIVAGGTAPKTCKAVRGRIEVCNSKYGRNGWLGLASVWLSDNHITAGTVKLNDTYFQMPAYNTPAERNHVMCQEIGHTLGLGHQDESGAALGTCMDYSMDVGSQHPNQHDYDELVQLYSHLDSSTTLLSSTNTARRYEAPEDRGNWGVRVHRSANGRSEIYVRSDGAGENVITFVNLAE